MKLSVEEIKERADHTYNERYHWREAAKTWEKMWRLEPFKETYENALKADKVERVILPTPYNIVQLATRMIAGEPKVELPSASPAEKADKASQDKEAWLGAFWQRVNRQQRRNVTEDAAWLSMVRGRTCLELCWVEDVLPDRLKGRRLPILARTLDPMNVGVEQGPLYTDYAYHRYRAKRGYIQQHWPNFKFKSEPHKQYQSYRDEDYEVISFYYTDHHGSIYHAVVVDDDFAKEPHKTEYIDIPIIEATADGAPLSNELYRGLSLLHPLEQLWPYQCRLASQIGTGLLYYFYPVFQVLNPSGAVLDDIDVGPGETYTMPEGASLQVVAPDVNMQLAEQMLGLVDSYIQMATFPSVMYGKEPGDVQAGYGVNILAQQARGRINTIRANLEGLYEHANEVTMGMVEHLAEDGVPVWGRESGSEDMYQITLKPSQIKGVYDNTVSLIPEVPSDDTQKLTTWLQLAKERIISKQTYRDKAINVALPKDEDVRVAREMALEGEPLQGKRALSAIKESFPDSWEQIIAGTPLEQIAQQEAEWKEAQEEEKQQQKLERAQQKFQETGVPPKGYHLMPNGQLMPDEEHQGPLPANRGMPQQGQGPPPGPQPPGPMPGPPQPQPQPMPQPGPQGMQPPGVPGVPGQMTGQTMPQDLGLPPNAPPGMFQQMMGQGELSQEEILRRIGALPPQGGPPNG